MNLQRDDIDSLLEDSISWARTHQRAGRQESLYGSSSDGGSIALRIHGTEFEGDEYSMIVITRVTIPEPRQGQGLYRTFLSELDALDFGLRCHSMTENEWLAEHHRRHGYKEVDKNVTPSFYKVIGAPLPPLPDDPSKHRRPKLEKQHEETNIGKGRQKLKTRVIRRQLGQPTIKSDDVTAGV